VLQSVFSEKKNQEKLYASLRNVVALSHYSNPEGAVLLMLGFTSPDVSEAVRLPRGVR